ncbi:MAG: SDR family oxidoreductase [Rhodobiaceae bacterium]|jgi:NAD(P)-dependent dehydrogenase (short-subunit alcohol dehydrogenase family)|nr:SDR family oxidoreductase [Rhodobiaceae bacterium]MBT5518263.1 SDR family oxidoreductase [Rhodobiaceae bacterium]MBT7280311.1 SDR family oxidoreductase [Rhodobiaceae bacterium]MDG2496283.1 SDR family NAD(P)-dependent oxidoreductase [Alphaproteobacteria bacterium]
MPLTGKKILITGANGGLGRAIAALAQAQGATLALCEKTADLAQAAKAALPKPEAGALNPDAGVLNPDAGVHCAHADLRDGEAVAAMVAHAVDAMGGLDGVVNNAALLDAADAGPVETPLDSWQATLAVNVTGAFLVYQNALPHLIQQQSGSLVTLSSVVAHSASAKAQIAYTTSKGALEAMTREIALAHARDNIRANCVAPGPVLTERTAHYFDTPEKWVQRRQHIPMGRLGRPEEIAASVCFLLSDGAAWQTGSIMRVDGGISAAYVVDDTKGSDTP